VSDNEMKALIVAVHSAVREHYERTKPWGVDFVKFMIDFNEHGRIVEISYTPPIPEEYAALVDRVREVSQPHGKKFRGKVANVVVGFKNPSRN
jgi:hypothetical protein